jgi:hypothetical protein
MSLREADSANRKSATKQSKANEEKRDCFVALPLLSQCQGILAMTD